MTPAEKNIVKSLITVAWADGQMDQAEAQIVEGLLVGFDATESETEELLSWAKTRRQLDLDVPVAEMSIDDRELLLSNAALLTEADGEVSAGERDVLTQLAELLGFAPEKAKEIMSSMRTGSLTSSFRPLN